MDADDVLRLGIFALLFSAVMLRSGIRKLRDAERRLMEAKATEAAHDQVRHDLLEGAGLISIGAVDEAIEHLRASGITVNDKRGGARPTELA